MSQVINSSFRYSLPSDWKLGDGQETIRLGNTLQNYLVETLDVSKYCFQLECTRAENDPKGANYHFQGCFSLKRKVRVSTLCKKLNFTRWRGMEISPVHSKTCVERYSTKTESRVDVKYTWSDEVEVQLYNGTDLPDVLLHWQSVLESYIKGVIDDRRILWIYDPVGAGEKSRFCKYMDWCYRTVTIGYSSSVDALYTVSKTKNARAYLFDLTRTKPKLFSNGDLYSTLESVKNGHFMNSKYESKVVLMDVPHVVVFSNQLPELESLSQDRWCIYE